MRNLSSLSLCRYQLYPPISSASWYSPMLSGYVSLTPPSLLRVTVWAAQLVESFRTRKHPKHTEKIIVKIIIKTERILKNFLIIFQSIFISSPFTVVLKIIVAKQNDVYVSHFRSRLRQRVIQQAVASVMTWSSTYDLLVFNNTLKIWLAIPAWNGSDKEQNNTMCVNIIKVIKE